LAVALVLVAGTAAAETNAGRLIPFSIEDQFKETHTEAEFAGGTVALVWGDRKSRDDAAVWADSLTAAFSRRLPSGSWQVRRVVHTKGAPFFVKGKIRGSFPRDPAAWALLDWKGVFRQAYQPEKNHVTVFLFAADGALVARRTGQEVDPAVVQELVDAVAGPQAGLVAGRRPPPEDFPARLAAAARERLSHHVAYDGSYRCLAYPGGDVPDDVGVCCDVVVRAYRAVGIDLQRAVHEDMLADFAAYPAYWGLKGPDPNIDHRRVPNLQTFFARHGESLPITHEGADYLPGDLVTWMLTGNLPHIGIVVDGRSADGRRPLIVHNIGRGPELEDALFRFPLTGHYRYDGSR